MERLSFAGDPTAAVTACGPFERGASFVEHSICARATLRVERQWAEQYMVGAVHLRPTTRRAKRYSLDNHILPAFGSLPLVRITPLNVRGFVEALNTALAPPTVRSVYIVLRALLNAAVHAEVLAVSPRRGIKLPSERP